MVAMRRRMRRDGGRWPVATSKNVRTGPTEHTLILVERKSLLNADKLGEFCQPL